jgi:hypothetical protein
MNELEKKVINEMIYSLKIIKQRLENLQNNNKSIVKSIDYIEITLNELSVFKKIIDKKPDWCSYSDDEICDNQFCRNGKVCNYINKQF